LGLWYLSNKAGFQLALKAWFLFGATDQIVLYQDILQYSINLLVEIWVGITDANDFFKKFI